MTLGRKFLTLVLLILAAGLPNASQAQSCALDVEYAFETARLAGMSDYRERGLPHSWTIFPSGTDSEFQNMVLPFRDDAQSYGREYFVLDPIEQCRAGAVYFRPWKGDNDPWAKELGAAWIYVMVVLTRPTIDGGREHGVLVYDYLAKDGQFIGRWLDRGGGAGEFVPMS